MLGIGVFRPCLMLEVDVPGWSYSIGCSGGAGLNPKRGRRSIVLTDVFVVGSPPFDVVQSVDVDLLVVCCFLSVVISHCEEISAHGIFSIFLLSSGKCRV